MPTVELKLKNVDAFVGTAERQNLKGQVEAAANLLHKKTGPGAEFLGWVDLPKTIEKSVLARIQKTATRLRKNCQVVVVVGIGGSYLGAQAAITALSHPLYNLETEAVRKGPQILFAGTNLSNDYLQALLQYLTEKRFGIIMVSKSGTTTEPAIAFRFLKKQLEEQAGKEEARDRIVAITDKEKGALKTLADQEGYETYVVPDDVGGRYSVLTPVGLLPIAIAGIPFREMIKGAAQAQKELKAPFDENPCYQYAALRHALYLKGNVIELLLNYEPNLQYVAEWWKQLFGESEGKDGKGLFPAAANLTTDLHSLGQYIQDGRRHLFNTIISVGSCSAPLTIEKDGANLDGLNYLADKTVHYVNQKAMEGTLQAHVEGGVPNIELHLAELTPFSLGYLFYFFEKTCGINGYLLGVNPFDQPGVEAYKKNMFSLLGKPK